MLDFRIKECYNFLAMKNLKTLAYKIAQEEKKEIYLTTDNRECACAHILEILLEKTDKKFDSLSEEEKDIYWEASESGYSSIENFLNYLED